MELSKYLRDYSRTIPGKQQLLIGAYAKALEVIPRQLCDNAGFDATNILNKLRAKHAQVGTETHTHTHAYLNTNNTLSKAFGMKALLWSSVFEVEQEIKFCVLHVSSRCRVACGTVWTSTTRTLQTTSLPASGSRPSCASTL